MKPIYAHLSHDESSTDFSTVMLLKLHGATAIVVDTESCQLMEVPIDRLFLDRATLDMFHGLRVEDYGRVSDDADHEPPARPR